MLSYLLKNILLFIYPGFWIKVHAYKFQITPADYIWDETILCLTKETL